LKFAKSLDCNYVNFSNLIPYPGTEAYHWILSNGHFLVDRKDYLKSLSTYDNQPIFETTEFTSRQRKRITELGHDYYYKRILIWRLGKILGPLVYYITKIPGLRNLFSDFALNNRIGQIIYAFLSGQWE
jgi:hypothetical protein